MSNFPVHFLQTAYIDKKNVLTQTKLQYVVSFCEIHYHAQANKL